MKPPDQPASAGSPSVTDPALPPGFVLRPATVDDAEALTRLINDCNIAEAGEPLTDAASMRNDLTSPTRDPERDDVVVQTGDGAMAGYLQLWTDEPYDEIVTLVFVAPAHWGRGLSASLLRIGVERAREKLALSPPDLRVVAQAVRYVSNDAARDLLGGEGFAPVRRFRDMRIAFDAAPVRPAVPAGIAIRPFDRDRDVRPVYAALAEAFEDHWGHHFPSFDSFVHLNVEGDGARFDPRLWWIATERDEVIGALVGRTAAHDPSIGQVVDLGVRRAWRRRGVGLTLLLTAFDAMVRIGYAGASLSVDAESASGATHLYELAGMHVAHEWEIWEKELRPAAS